MDRLLIDLGRVLTRRVSVDLLKGSMPSIDIFCIRRPIRIVFLLWKNQYRDVIKIRLGILFSQLSTQCFEIPIRLVEKEMLFKWSKVFRVGLQPKKIQFMNQFSGGPSLL